MATFRGGDASDFDFTAVEPEDAVEYFRRKGYKVGFDWRDVWQDEHARAFTVAKAMTCDLLEDIRSVVDEAIADGIAFEDFQAKLEPILRARGWWGRQLMEDPLTGKEREVQLGSARRLGIIYDTNLRMSCSAGSWAQVERTKKDLPYLRYWDPDPNPRPQHLDWSGTILSADDPWWDAHYPPNGWHCKCLVDSLSESDLSRYGYERSATAPPAPTYTYENRRTGKVSQVQIGIDPGFAYNPGKAGIRYAAEKDLTEKLATATPDIRKAVAKIKPPKEPRPVLPGAFEVRGRASVDFRHAAQEAYEKIPAHLREQTEAAGHRVILGRTLPEIDRTLSGKRPRGWPEGSSFKQVGGVFLPWRRTVAVVEYVEKGAEFEARSAEQVAYSMHHEFGHSLDAAVGISRGAEFRRAYRNDVQRLRLEQRDEFAYFLQPGEAGPEEAFAQLFAELMGARTPPGTAIAPHFPECAAVVQSLMRESLR